MLSMILMLGIVAQTHDDTGRYELKYYRAVTSDGLHVTVKGWVEPGDKSINWYSDDPFNVRSVAEARSKKARGDYSVNGVVMQDRKRKRDAYTLPSEEAKDFVARTPHYVEQEAKIHVTVIGSEQERQAVISDIENRPEFSSLKDSLMYQAYDPGHWAVNPSLGFQPGSPAIIVQTGKCQSDPKGGRVIYRATDYSAGYQPIIEAIRKANPSYNPALDPGVTEKGKCPLGLTRSDTYAAILCSAIVFVLWMTRKE